MLQPACTGTACNLAVGVFIECKTCATTDTAFSSPIPVHFDNITASANGITNNNVGFLIKGVPVILTNSHVENYQPNIQIGNFSGTNTNGVRVENVSLGISQIGGIFIMTHCSNITLAGISGPPNTPGYVLVQNEYINLGNNTFPRVVGQFLGFYMFGGFTTQTCGKSGTISIPCQALLDTAPTVAEWHEPANTQ